MSKNKQMNIEEMTVVGNVSIEDHLHHPVTIHTDPLLMTDMHHLLAVSLIKIYCIFIIFS